MLHIKIEICLQKKGKDFLDIAKEKSEELQNSAKDKFEQAKDFVDKKTKKEAPLKKEKKTPLKKSEIEEKPKRKYTRKAKIEEVKGDNE